MSYYTNPQSVPPPDGTISRSSIKGLARVLGAAVLLSASSLVGAQTYPTDVANTVTVTVPGTVVDPTPGNNTATDTNTLSASADLVITKTRTSDSPALAGSTVTYNIVVSNDGPSTAFGATIADTVPTQLGGVTWTCTASGTSSCGTASGSGDISLLANVVPGAGNTITIAVTGTAPTSGTIDANTATVTPGTGTTDPDETDNASTSPAIPVTAVADLSMAKTLTSATPVRPLSTVTYELVVSNAGPSAAVGAMIVDNVPAELTDVTWTCSAGAGSSCGSASGSGNAISLTADIPSGSNVTITVTGTAPASGTIGANTATVSPPDGTTDPDPGDDSDTVNPIDLTPLQADIAVTKSDGASTYTPGGTASYTITVTNAAGPDAITGISVSDTLPAGVTLSGAWSCSASAGSACSAASGGSAGDSAISLTVDLDVGGTVTITVPVSFSADPAAY